MNDDTPKTETIQKSNKQIFNGKASPLERITAIFAIIGTIAQLLSLGVQISDSMHQPHSEVRNVKHIEANMK